MRPDDRRPLSQARRKHLADTARRRRHAHVAEEARRLQDDRRLRVTEYDRTRQHAWILKRACKFLGVSCILLLVIFHIWTATHVPDGGPFLFHVQALLYVALAAFCFALVYLLILGVEALLDNADQTRESLDFQERLLAELRFSGESLSEMVEAQVEEDPDPGPPAPPPPPPREAPPPAPPPPPGEHEPPPPEPPKPEPPRTGPGSFLPLDSEGD